MTCNERSQNASYFSVCRACKKDPWSLHAYGRGLFAEWKKHMKIYGTFDNKIDSVFTPFGKQDNEWDTLSSQPKVHVVYAFAKEERYLSLRGSTQTTPFVQFSHDDLYQFWQSRLWTRKKQNEDLTSFDYSFECEQFTRSLCSTSAADYKRLQAFTHLRNKKKQKMRTARKKLFQVFWERSDWGQEDWKDHATFLNGTIVFRQSNGKEANEPEDLNGAIQKILSVLKGGGETATMVRNRLLPFLQAEPQTEPQAVQTEPHAVQTEPQSIQTEPQAVHTEPRAEVHNASVQATVPLKSVPVQATLPAALALNNVGTQSDGFSKTETEEVDPTPQKQHQNTQTGRMEGLYWYVKQKNIDTLVGKRTPETEKSPTLRKVSRTSFLEDPL